MILKLFAKAIFVVLLLAIVDHLAGAQVVDAVVSHISGAINELSDIAKAVAGNRFAGSVVSSLKNLVKGF